LTSGNNIIKPAHDPIKQITFYKKNLVSARCLFVIFSELTAYRLMQSDSDVGLVSDAVTSAMSH